MGNILFLLYRRAFYLPILMQFADSIAKLNIKSNIHRGQGLNLLLYIVENQRINIILTRHYHDTQIRLVFLAAYHENSLQ